MVPSMGIELTNNDVWLTNHPYLRRIADLQNLVDATLGELSIPTVSTPPWDSYARDFVAGVPLLLSPDAGIELSPVQRCFACFLEKLALKPLVHKLALQVRDLIADLQTDATFSSRVIAELLENNEIAFRHPGLIRYSGWTVLAKSLHPLVEAFAHWRDEESWLRDYCPMCGGRPAMAQLVGCDPGRLRLLVCGCCMSRWRFRRTGCPFCKPEDDHRLSVLSIEGENALRIEYCLSCGGYLKTYVGEGRERLLLADWTTIHLDIIARDLGLASRAGSLYQL
jgi:FdhE protein